MGKRSFARKLIFSVLLFTNCPPRLTFDPVFESCRLLEKSIEKAARDSGVTSDYLSGLQAGPVKRQIIDDVTIMVIDLEN